MRSFRPRLWMLLSLVAFVAFALAGVAWWRRTTIISQGWSISWPGGIPDPKDPSGGATTRHFSRYADGHIEYDPGVK